MTLVVGTRIAVTLFRGTGDIARRVSALTTMPLADLLHDLCMALPARTYLLCDLRVGTPVVPATLDVAQHEDIDVHHDPLYLPPHISSDGTSWKDDSGTSGMVGPQGGPGRSESVRVRLGIQSVPSRAATAGA